MSKINGILTALACIGLFIYGIFLISGHIDDRTFGKKFTFVVPEGYRGPLIIREDSAAGKSPLEGDLHFDKSGATWVKSFGDFQMTHRIYCRDKKGNTIKRFGTKTDPSDIVIRGSYVSSSGSETVRYYFVGSEIEEQKFIESIWAKAR